MNRLKSIGISALAGTLVSLSAAQAGGVSVTGSWELSYTNLNHTKVSGNKIGMNKNIAFGASGDVSDGGAVTWGTTIGMSDAAGLSSASMNINMGGIATLAYDSGTGGYGANAVDNIVPTAWEEIDYGLSTGIVDVGAISSSKGVINLTVKAPVAGTALSVSYVNSVGGGHIADGATSGEVNGGRGIDAVVDLVNYNAAHFGYRFGFAAELEDKEMTCNDRESQKQSTTSCLTGHKDNPYGGTGYMTLKLGPLSMGVQGSFKDPMDPTIDGIANKRSLVAGAALTFGDTISVSYGEAWSKYKYNNAARGGDSGSGDSGGVNLNGKGGEYVDIFYSGFSASINFGPVALKGTKNRVGGWGENAAESGEGVDKDHSEINLSIAF
jgi:hypothetical protein